MQIHKVLKPLYIGCSAIVISTVPQFAGAQEAILERPAQERGDVLEEIVVRGLLREQALQETPATVSVFSEQAIENIGVSNVRDFAKLVPNLFLIETQNSTFTFINIRGISQSRNVDPSVAMVVDGVLSTSQTGLSQELFDVEQIEVLKGPQGALYGRNAIGGAIVITTKEPSNEVEGFLRAGFGNGDSGKVQAAVSGPLIADQLFGRVAASFYSDEGFRKNVTLGTNGDKAENFSIRSRLLWKRTDDFRADLRFSFSEDNNDALGFIDLAPIWHETFPGSGVSLGQAVGAFRPGTVNFEAGPVTSGLPISRLFVPGQPANVGNPNINSVPLQSGLLGIDKREIYNVSLKLDWQTPIGTVLAVSSYDYLTNYAIGAQGPRTAIQPQKNTQFRSSEAFSQDVRLTSPQDQRLTWFAGAYIVQTDTWFTTTVQRNRDGRDSLTDLVRRDPFAIPSGVCNPSPFPIGGPTDNQGNCIFSFQGDEGDNLAYAFYGQVAFKILDDLELIVSGRWDRDERDQIIRTPTELFIIPTDLRFGDQRSANFDSFQPKATLRWQALPNLMTYVTYAEGFRSGGFNQAGVEDLANTLRGDPTVLLPIPEGIFDVFPQQDTQGFEAGVRFNTPGDRLIFNASGFYTNVDDMQTFFGVQLDRITTQVVIPIKKVKLWGAEVDASLEAHDFFRLNVGFGWTGSDIRSDPFRGNEGNDAPNTPTTTLNVTGQYRQPVTIGTFNTSVFLVAEYQRIGKIFFNPGNFARRDELNLVNLRGGIEVDGGWRFEGWAKNLTNKNYIADIFNPAGFAFPGKLRQYGFEFTKRF